MGTYDPNAMEYQYESEPEYNQDDDADGVVEVEDDGHIEDWLSKHYYNSASAGTPYANPNTRSDVGNMNSNRYNNSNSNTGNVSKLSRYAHRQGVAYNNNSYNDSTSTGNGNNDSGQGSPQVNQIHRVVSKSESLKPSLSTSQSPSEVEGECSSGRDLNSNGNGAGSGTGNDNSYAKSKQWAMQREEKLNNERVQREKILELECSFKPNINGGGSGTANSNKTNKSIKSTIPTGVRMDNSNNSNTNSPGSNSSTSSIPHLHLYPAKLKPSFYTNTNTNNTAIGSPHSDSNGQLSGTGASASIGNGTISSLPAPTTYLVTPIGPSDCDGSAPVSASVGINLLASPLPPVAPEYLLNQLLSPPEYISTGTTGGGQGLQIPVSVAVDTRNTIRMRNTTGTGTGIVSQNPSGSVVSVPSIPSIPSVAELIEYDNTIAAYPTPTPPTTAAAAAYPTSTPTTATATAGGASEMGARARHSYHSVSITGNGPYSGTNTNSGTGHGANGYSKPRTASSTITSHQDNNAYNYNGDNGHRGTNPSNVHGHGGGIPGEVFLPYHFPINNSVEPGLNPMTPPHGEDFLDMVAFPTPHPPDTTPPPLDVSVSPMPPPPDTPQPSDLDALPIVSESEHEHEPEPESNPACDPDPEPVVPFYNRDYFMNTPSTPTIPVPESAPHVNDMEPALPEAPKRVYDLSYFMGSSSSVSTNNGSDSVGVGPHSGDVEIDEDPIDMLTKASRNNQVSIKYDVTHHTAHIAAISKSKFNQDYSSDHPDDMKFQNKYRGLPSHYISTKFSTPPPPSMPYYNVDATTPPDSMQKRIDLL